MFVANVLFKAGCLCFWTTNTIDRQDMRPLQISDADSREDHDQPYCGEADIMQACIIRLAWLGYETGLLVRLQPST